MLRFDVSYPYPVLRPVAIDYVSSVFTDKIERENTSNGYKLKTSFSVNNEILDQMINDGILGYAVFISCSSTLLREMRFVDPANPVIEIDAGSVHYLVNYNAYIIALQDIDHFSVPDFVDDYKGIDFSIKRGSVIGIGTARNFRALFEKDVIRDASSIIKVSGSDKEKYMKVDLDGSQIKVILPTDQCTIYKSFAGRKQRYSLLHSVIIIPALVEAITTIKNTDEEEDLAKMPWFITLQQTITKIAQDRNESEETLYDSPVRTAQIIMDNNSAAALKAIEEIP